MKNFLLLLKLNFSIKQNDMLHNYDTYKHESSKRKKKGRKFFPS